MKTRIILVAIVLSIAIWFGIGWLIDLFGFNDYGFIRSIVIVVVVYFAVEIIKEIDND